MQLAGVVALLDHDQIVGLVEDAATLLHDEAASNVRTSSRTGDQRAAQAATGTTWRPRQYQCSVRQIALGDAEETGQAAFGGEKVVAGLIELAAFDAVADRQKATLRAEEEAEVHRECQIASLVAQCDPGAGRAASMLARSKVLSEIWASQTLTSALGPVGDLTALVPTSPRDRGWQRASGYRGQEPRG